LDLKLVKELLALMDEGGLTELHYAHGETEVRLSRQNDAPVMHSVAAPAVAAAPVAPVTPMAVEPEEDNALYFTSPMVGTFYSRPNPESDAFVEAGDSVGGDDVICILEAMKVFNEIHAEFRGTIIEVLASDGDTVEFGQNLFKYKA
jgi:acetyl-CoA carboxylase biotin carboxyl carrier protein|tara:strand:- start:384 stop:824 length:441 start_codon:yes stop_codon:yes gene_type:complete